ncbi:MAG: DUF302 domain-containing protein [Cyanobacteria bacterium NC_groundwater_1444_Ag_S-0.65um_54_12]|nr:DUF302 domain-containing protein [Cyanobacteria bacterium NC_groundwater_1444_Ag_S-0.65um_54_12]
MQQTRICLDYTVTTEKPLLAAVAAVTDRATAKGFRVLHVHDVAATLASKGFEREPYQIIEICQAKAAHQALASDPLVGLLMPCKVNVYSQGGKTVLSALRPAILADFFPGRNLDELAREVDELVCAIVDEACQ